MALVTLCNPQVNEQGRELTRHGSALFPIACYHDALSLGAVPWHWHPELEVFTVSGGTAIAAAGAERFAVCSGQGFFVNTQVLHAVWPQKGSDCRLHSAVFHPRLVGGNLDSVFWSKYLQPLLNKGGPPCVHLDGGEDWHADAVCAMEQAWTGCVQESPGYEFQAREGLSRLIFLLSRHHVHASSSKPDSLLREESRVKLMLEYIHQHYDEKLNTAVIARAAAVSESECLRCFRRIIGMPPIQYVTQYRIQKAAELLMSAPELSVAEVGARCGFQDASYFTKTFHALTEYTPSEYRHQERSNFLYGLKK